MKSQYSILVVDDEETILKLLKTRFEREQYQVHTCQNADAALGILAANPNIAVVVTDIKMPGMSGLELTQKIKVSHPEQKVIVMTGHGEKSTAINSLKVGASDYLEKPFDVEEMLHSVERTMREYTLERQGSNVIPFRAPNTTPTAESGEQKMNYTAMKKLWIDQFEKDFILKLLQKQNGNVTAAAKEAGLDRSNFLRLLRRHQIQAQQFRKAA